MTEPPSARQVRGALDGGWAEAFRRLASRLTHELRNPLNGLMVNLEVLKGRSARENLSAGTLRPFAEAAAAEGARTVSLFEAFLTLARATPAPVDLGGALRPLITVLDAIAARSGGKVTLEESVVAVEADADADLVRLATFAVMESSLETGREIRLRPEADSEHATLRISGVDHPSAPNERNHPSVYFVRVASGDVLIRFPPHRGMTESQ